MIATLDTLSSSPLAEQQSQIPENKYFEPPIRQSVWTTNYDELLEWALSESESAKQHIVTGSTLSEFANRRSIESLTERQHPSIPDPLTMRSSFPAKWRPSIQKQSAQVLRSFTGRVETIQGLFARVTLRESGTGEPLLGDCHASTLKAAQIEEGDLFRMDIRRIAGNVTVLFTKTDPPDRSAEEVASIEARLADLD